jgi:hypothetical protein
MPNMTPNTTVETQIFSHLAAVSTSRDILVDEVAKIDLQKAGGQSGTEGEVAVHSSAGTSATSKTEISDSALSLGESAYLKVLIKVLYCYWRRTSSYSLHIHPIL